jgi:hypothetical protein
MNNFNDEVCEYNYSSYVTENFADADTQNNKKIMTQHFAQYDRCVTNCQYSHQMCQMFKTESSFDFDKCMAPCQDILKEYENNNKKN